MNEEHFLTELKIYLNPLQKDQLDAILASFATVFAEGKESSLSEEEIAKSLGKPKDIAKEILQLYHITVKEKEIYQNDWQEIEPEYSKEEDFSSYAKPIPDTPRQKTPFLPRFLLLLFNIFVGIWLIFGLYAMLVGAWVTVAAFFVAPFISLAGFFFLPFTVSMLQLSISLILAGVAFFMVLVGRPITKFIHRNTKRYFQFSNRIWKGEN